MTDHLELQYQGVCAEIVLNRPDKRNAVSAEMWRTFPGLITEAVANPATPVIILHGGVSGAFAAGADISEFEATYATREAAAASGQTIARALEALESCPKPIIAAIEGPCVGAGISLALTADVRFGAEGSRYGIPPAKLGLVYPAGDTRRLIAAVGPSRAKDLLFSGRLCDAETAHAIGLIDYTTAKGEAIVAARSYGDTLAANSQWSIKATKQMIAGLDSGWADNAADALALFQEGFANADFKDGYRAFLEKRPAKFTVR